MADDPLSAAVPVGKEAVPAVPGSAAMEAPEGAASSPTPTAAPAKAASAAQAASEAPAAAPVMTFDMAADDDDDADSTPKGQAMPSVDAFLSGEVVAASRQGGASSGSASSGASGRPEESWDAPTRPAQSGPDLAAQTRERLRFLCPEDQKTVCRRECEIAHKREDDLLKRLQQTIDRYEHALEVCRAVDSGNIPAATPPPFQQQEPQREGPTLSPELASKYEERIRLLRGTIAALTAEPTVNLPKLTAAEQVKGFAFASYAQTAEVASRLASNPAIGGAKNAISSWASRFRGGGEAGGYSGNR